MPDWLSEEWSAGATELSGLLPPIPGAQGTVSLAVTGSGRKEVRVGWSYADGVAGPASGADVADLALTAASADAIGLLKGEVEPSVAFMRGRLKASGDGALLLGFLASTANERFGAWRRQVASLAPETA